MTSRDFCYWLQGFFEICRGGPHAPSLSLNQIDCIEKHLALVFKHEIDPGMGSIFHQQTLNQVHTPTVPPSPTMGVVPPSPTSGNLDTKLFRC